MTRAMGCMAGGNWICTGDQLRTARDAGDDSDAGMFARRGIKPMAIELTEAQVEAQRMPKGCAKLEAAE